MQNQQYPQQGYPNQYPPQQYNAPQQYGMPPQYGQPQQFGVPGDLSGNEQLLKLKEQNELEMKLQTGFISCYYVIQWIFFVLEILSILGSFSNFQFQNFIGLLVSTFATFCAIFAIREKNLTKATIAYVLYIIQAVVLAILSILIFALRSYLIDHISPDANPRDRDTAIMIINIISAIFPIWFLIHLLVNVVGAHKTRNVLIQLEKVKNSLPVQSFNA